MRKIIYIFLILSQIMSLYAVDNTVGSSSGKYEKVGTAGGQFLKIDVGARAAGMGGAYTSVANDLTSLYWNPAGIADVKGVNANFSYTQWFAGFDHGFAGISMSLGDNFVAALHVLSLNSGNIPITTIEQPNGTGAYYTINDVAIGASFGGYLTEQFSFGATFKYIKNSFATVSASGIAFDLGTMYQTGIQGIKLGFALSNLGTEQNYSGQALNTSKKLFDAMSASPIDASFVTAPFSIPLTFRAGVSSEVLKIEYHKILLAGDFITLSDTKEQFAIGTEYVFHDILFARAGYRTGIEQLGFSFGFGLKYYTGNFMGQVDYSFNNSQNFGAINRIAVSVAIK